MDKKPESQVRRRDFLKDSAIAAVVGVSFLSLDLREAIAQAKQTGKPLFTENNLNRLIRANPLTSRRGQKLGSEAMQDPKSFVRSHFHLTRAQEEELESVTLEDLKRIADTFGNLLNQQGRLLIKIVSDIRGSNPRESDAFVKAAYLEPARNISIDVGCTTDGGLSCHFTITKKS